MLSVKTTKAKVVHSQMVDVDGTIRAEGLEPSGIEQRLVAIIVNTGNTYSNVESVVHGTRLDISREISSRDTGESIIKTAVCD